MNSRVDNTLQLEIASAIEKSPTFSEILDNTARKFSNQIFLIEGEKQWSYLVFNNLVNHCCRYFKNLGLERGDIVSCILRNSVDYLIIYFAALRSRVILNPFPYHLSANELLEKIEIVKPKYLFCHKGHFNQLSKSKHTIINLDEIAGKNFLQLLEKFSGEEFQSPEIDSEQTAILYYSSGTTGSPKIIEYSHKSMVMSQASMIRSGFTFPGSVHLCVLPLGHTASLRYTIKQCICTGSTVVLYESFWKLRSRLWEDVEKYSATFFEVVPSILIAILNTPYKNFKKGQVSSIDFVGCGSAYLPKSLQDAFESKYGIPVANLYGLSETGATHFDNPRVPGRKTGNIGHPFDISKVKLFKEDGKEVKKGEIGEFGVKGPGVLKGYYENQTLYKKCFKNGYFITGDLGKQDEDGVYYYIDRKKDLIIKGGVNIVPAQIDEILLSHPSIEEAATIGTPDVLMGENIKSYVVLKHGIEIDVNNIRLYCKEKLGDFKTPTEIEIISDLPKGPSGKILKRELRKREFDFSPI